MIPVTVDAAQLLRRGTLTLSRIESNGVRVNVDYLNSTIKETGERIKVLEKEMKKDDVYRLWVKRFGNSANLTSRTQLGEILFSKDYLGYKPKGVTSTGRVSVTKNDIDDIDIPFIEKFIQVENLKKTYSTYLKGISQEMVKNGQFWYVHPVYNVHTISTFRSSSNSPNFQNQPKRNPEMVKLIRPCYLPHPGHHFVEADFSQLEVRIAACYNKDPMLIRYIQDPTTDMHRDACMDMFFLSKDLYAKHKDYFKKTARDSAKNQFVFPQTYGSNYVNCAKAIWKSMKQRKFMCGELTMFEQVS